MPDARKRGVKYHDTLEGALTRTFECGDFTGFDLWRHAAAGWRRNSPRFPKRGCSRAALWCGRGDTALERPWMGLDPRRRRPARGAFVLV